MQELGRDSSICCWLGHELQRETRHSCYPYPIPCTSLEASWPDGVVLRIQRRIRGKAEYRRTSSVREPIQATVPQAKEGEGSFWELINKFQANDNWGHGKRYGRVELHSHRRGVHTVLDYQDGFGPITAEANKCSQKA